jgi:hypothetical protein
VRHGVAVTALTAALTASALGGCSDDSPSPAAPAPTSTPPSASAYDGRLEPSAAVLALVPEDAEVLTVTDFDRVRQELGMDDVGGHSTPDEVAVFWHRADAERPLLSGGLLRPADQRLSQKYGFTQVDVAWEAHFLDADDHELGWAMRFRDDTDMAKVGAAVGDPATPLSGAVVDAAEHLVTRGASADPQQSWAADPGLEALVGEPANSAYVSRSCVPDAAATGDVDELGAYSVEFEGSLVTARLGEGRHDLFARMRLGAQDPDFAAAYDGGVADPTTGRIGYVMTDPAAAAQLALRHELPFATCA